MKHINLIVLIFILFAFSGCNFKIEKDYPSCFESIQNQFENSNYDNVIYLLNNENISKRQKTDWYYYDYAVSLFKINEMNVRKALTLMKMAYQFNPKSYEINYYLGRFYFEIGEYKKAIKYFSKSQKSDHNQDLYFAETTDCVFWIIIINSLYFEECNLINNFDYEDVIFFDDSKYGVEEKILSNEYLLKKYNKFSNSYYSTGKDDSLNKIYTEYLDSKVLYKGIVEKNDELIESVLSKYSNNGIVVMTSKSPIVNEIFYKNLTFYYWIKQDGLKANNAFHIYQKYHSKPHIQKDKIEYDLGKIEKEFSNDSDLKKIKELYNNVL